MSTLVDPSELLATQKALRDRLLRGNSGYERRPLHELASRMLLYLDEPQACWDVCLDWLIGTTSADRIDGGYAQARNPLYRVGFERLRQEIVLPSVLGQSMDARDPSIALVWQSRSAVVYHDIASDHRLGAPTKALLHSMGTRRKLAVALRDGPHQIGLLCCDQVSAHKQWAAWECDMVDSAAREVMGPVLHASQRLNAALAAPSAATEDGMKDGRRRQAITPAEWRVAELVVSGLSYKEIARQLDRSCSTVDHQLRSMRRKFGVDSTAKLMRELFAQFPNG